MKPVQAIAANIHVYARDILYDFTVLKPKNVPTSCLLAFVFWLHTGCFNVFVSHGTAAFAFWMRDRIVLAVDSKVRHMAGEPPSQGCKIRASGKFYFVASGYYKNARTGYDVWKIAESTLLKATTIPSAASALETAIAPRLAKALDDLRQSDPMGFRREFAETYLAFVVAGVDDGNPVLAGRNFHPDGVDEVQFPLPNRTDGVGYLAFGERAAVDRVFSREAKVALASSNMVNAARVFVQMEIEENPAKVGPPIAILEITSSDTRWIEQGVCRQEQDK